MDLTRLVCLLGLVCLLTPSYVRPETVELQPAADTTLFEVEPDNNLGGADFFNAGTTRDGTGNRALLRFDFTTGLPVDAMIQVVELLLDVIRIPQSSAASSTFELRRVLRPWGEGDKVPEDPGSPGRGALATVNEATWNDRFALSTAPWAVPGGVPGTDFSSLASATAFVEGLGNSPYRFSTTPQFVADVQFWLGNPQSNFGWILMTQSEGVPRTARSFASRENSGSPPTLTVEYQIVPEPAGWTLVAIGILLLVAAHWRTSRSRG